MRPEMRPEMRSRDAMTGCNRANRLCRPARCRTIERGAPKHDLGGPVEPAFLSRQRGCRRRQPGAGLRAAGRPCWRARAGEGAPEIAAPEVNAWIVIAPDDTVVIRVSRSEMGQGTFTALPMLVAEELECDWDKVKPEYASRAENLRRHRAWGDMSTNASRSVSASQQTSRQAGATAREMLIAAAATRWAVPARECRAENSTITHLPSGRTVRFGDVAEAAAAVRPPAHVKLKEPKGWKLIGTPQKRFDVLDKITAQPIYGIDVRLPD